VPLFSRILRKVQTFLSDAVATPGQGPLASCLPGTAPWYLCKEANNYGRHARPVCHKICQRWKLAPGDLPKVTQTATAK